MTLIRSLTLLALICWLGGIIFFAFVLAPTVFSVLPTRELAGNVVSRSLTALHWIGIVAAIVLLVCSMMLSRAKRGQLEPFAFVNILTLVMLALTMASQFGITPRLRTLRAEMVSIDYLAWNDPRRMEFDRLHEWSTRAEGSVLFLGLGVVILNARRFGS